MPWLAYALTAGVVDGFEEPDSRRLKALQVKAAQTTLAAHAAATSVVARLNQVGVHDVVLLKGVATGHLDHERPTDRFSSDVDLLIRSEDRSRVLNCFPAHAEREPRRAYWQQRYAKSTTVVDESGVEIDVHTMLTQGYFGYGIPSDDLFASTVPFSIGATELRALDGPNRLVHAANHVGDSRTGLHSARDVPQLVLVSGVDWEEAIIRSQRWKIDALFATGVIDAWSRFPIDDHPLVEWARSVAPSGRQRVALRLVGDRPRGHLLTAPLALPVWEWPAYVFPLVFPSRAYLRANRKTFRDRTSSMMRELVGRR